MNPSENFPNLPRTKKTTDETQKILEKANQNKEKSIIGEDAIDILKAYGISAAEYSYASSAKDAQNIV